MKKIQIIFLTFILFYGTKLNAQCSSSVPARSPNTGIPPVGLSQAIKTGQSFTPTCSGRVVSMTFTFDATSDDFRGTGDSLKCNLKNAAGTIIAKGIWPNGKEAYDVIFPATIVTVDFACSGVALIAGTQYNWELQDVSTPFPASQFVFLLAKSTTNVYVGGDLIQDGVTTANKDLLGWTVTMSNGNIAASTSTKTQNVSCNAFYNAIPELMCNVLPNGASPISGNTTAKLWLETTQPAQFVKRHYEVTPAANATTATGRVTLYFTQQEFTDFNAVNTLKLPTGPADAAGIANMLIEKRPGSSSNSTGLPNTYGTPVSTINPADADIVWNSGVSRWEVTFDVTGFSGFFVKTTTGILPIKWLSVSGSLNNSKQALLYFKVNEISVAKYEIEKSNDGRNFNLIGTIISKGNGENDYHFTETKSLDGLKFYRLKQIDNDGRYSYSSVIKLSNQLVDALSVYPNPVKDLLSISGATIGSKAILTDISGKVLQQLIILQTSFTLDMKEYSKGVYLLKTDNGVTQKVIKE